MNLPKVIAALIKAQEHFDSVAYSNCFSDTAVVFDEGKTHTGKTAIQHWIAQGNEQYKTVMKPVEFTETDTTTMLLAEISGTFDGSPLMLKFHFEIIHELIQTLKITG